MWIISAQFYVESILKHKAMDYSKDLYNLSQADTFQMVDFENVIDVIRTCVTEVIYLSVCLQVFLNSVHFIWKTESFNHIATLYINPDIAFCLHQIPKNAQKNNWF